VHHRQRLGRAGEGDVEEAKATPLVGRRGDDGGGVDHHDGVELQALGLAGLDEHDPPVEAGGVGASGVEPGVEESPLDLGGTVAELLYLGRGHTDNDLLVHLPASGVWLTGDLVEESGPPVYGPDSFPLDWPATMGRLQAALSEGDLLVPGHGAVVGPAFAAVHAGSPSPPGCWLG